MGKMAAKAGKTSAQKAQRKAHRKKRRELLRLRLQGLEKHPPRVGYLQEGHERHELFRRRSFERLALEASKLARVHGKQTMTSNDVQSAVKLVLPGDLAEHAIAEGTRALNKFGSSTA